MSNSLRDEVKDAIKAIIGGMPFMDVDDTTCQIADAVFGVMEIPESEQDANADGSPEEEFDGMDTEEEFRKSLDDFIEKADMPQEEDALGFVAGQDSSWLAVACAEQFEKLIDNLGNAEKEGV